MRRGEQWKCRWQGDDARRRRKDGKMAILPAMTVDQRAMPARWARRNGMIFSRPLSFFDGLLFSRFGCKNAHAVIEIFKIFGRSPNTTNHIERQSNIQTVCLSRK